MTDTLALQPAQAINIDQDPIFVNPFTNIEPIEASFRMYETYLKNKSNIDILTRIGNNEIISEDYESFGVTRSEILQKVACKLKLRNKLTTVRRNILNNQSGIIVNQVNCVGDTIGGSLSLAISNQYPIVKKTYDDLKVKYPGEIQLINVLPGKYPLVICNIFGRLKSEAEGSNQEPCSDSARYPLWALGLKSEAEGSNQEPSEKIELSSIKKFFFKKALIKLKAKILKQKLDHLSVYIPYDIGKHHGWSWDDYEPFITRYLPDAIICKD